MVTRTPQAQQAQQEDSCNPTSEESLFESILTDSQVHQAEEAFQKKVYSMDVNRRLALVTASMSKERLRKAVMAKPKAFMDMLQSIDWSVEEAKAQLELFEAAKARLAVVMREEFEDDEIWQALKRRIKLRS